MGDMAEVFRVMKQHDKKRRARNRKAADPTGWVQHTDYHWSRKLNGERLDYWPSRNKFMYQGRVMVGDIVGFIRKLERSDGEKQ